MPEISDLNPYRETRRKRSCESAEDYTEAIADLIESQGEARICQLAKKMGVSHVTVSRTVRRLERDGFVKLTPHFPLKLTPKGKKCAALAKKRHRLLLDFLLLLGVPAEVAAIDVEGIEHHISPVTFAIIERFVTGLRKKES